LDIAGTARPAHVGVRKVPVVTAGAGESLLVLSDGHRLTELLRLLRLLRVHTRPGLSVAVPAGLGFGVMAVAVRYLPFPTRLETAALEAVAPASGAAATGGSHGSCGPSPSGGLCLAAAGTWAGVQAGRCMLNRLVTGVAGLACGIMLTVPSRLDQGVSLVNVADGIGCPSRAAPAGE